MVMTCTLIKHWMFVVDTNYKPCSWTLLLVNLKLKIWEWFAAISPLRDNRKKWNLIMIMNFRESTKKKARGHLWFLMWMRKDSTSSWRPLILLKMRICIFRAVSKMWKPLLCFTLWIWFCFIHTLTHVEMHCLNLMCWSYTTKKVKYRIYYLPKKIYERIFIWFFCRCLK